MVIQLLTVLLWAAFLFKLVQFVRAPDDRPLRAVTLGLGSATVAFTVGREPIEGLLHGLALGLPTLIRNLGMIGAFSAITAFFVHATQPPQIAVRAMRRHTAVLLAVAGLTTVLWLIMPTAARLDPRSAGAWGIGFLLAAVTGLLYAATVAARHTLRHARAAQLPRVRRGLGILSAGLLASVVANLISASSSLALLVIPREHPAIAGIMTAYLIAAMVAIPGLVLGLAYPIGAAMAAAVPTWWRHRREYRALAPLWRQARRAWPDVMLRRPAGVLRPSIHARRYRRATEIRDALMLLQPYYPVRPDGLNGDVRAHAADLDEALRLRAEALDDGSHPVGGAPTGAAPAARNAQIDADISWLVQLSRALVQHQRTSTS